MGGLDDELRLEPISKDGAQLRPADDRWNERERGETETQRLDRNLSALMQELRVTLTGVQLLAGFLLIVPFQARFADLSGLGVALYLTTTAAAILAVVVLVAPIATHRLLFRRHQLATIVASVHRLMLAGLLLIAVAVVGAVALVVLVVTAVDWIAAVAAVTISLAVIMLWLVIPLRKARSGSSVRDSSRRPDG